MSGDGSRQVDPVAQKAACRKKNTVGQAKQHQRQSTAVVCQVEGCTRRLSREKEYYQRYKVCKFHSSQSTVLLDGVPHRFCQQCCCFELLSSFDGDRRSCRARLLLHNSRRKQRVDSRSCNLSDVEEEAKCPASTAVGGSTKKSSASTPRQPQAAMSSPFGNSPPPVQTAAVRIAAAEEGPPLPGSLQRGGKSGIQKWSPTVGVNAWSDPGEGACTESQAAAPASGTCSCPSAEGANSRDFPDKYAATRSQSAQFSVSGVAEMWAKDDEVHGGDVLAGLDCDLDFASLSVSLDEVPAEGIIPPAEGHPHDAAAAVAVPHSMASPQGGGSGEAAPCCMAASAPQQPSSTMYPAAHPAAAAPTRQWAAHIPQEAAAEPPAVPHFGSPTAQLLKRHWSDMQDDPKPHFAPVSWGSGSSKPPKPKRMQVDSGDLSSTAVTGLSMEPPGHAMATLQQVEASLLAAGAINDPFPQLARPGANRPLSASFDSIPPLSATFDTAVPPLQQPPPRQFDAGIGSPSAAQFTLGMQHAGATSNVGSSGGPRLGRAASGSGSPQSALTAGAAVGMGQVGVQQPLAAAIGSGSFVPGLGSQWEDPLVDFSSPQQQPPQSAPPWLPLQQERATTRTYSQPSLQAARGMRMMQMGSEAQQSAFPHAGTLPDQNFSSTRQASLPATGHRPYIEPRLTQGVPLGHGLILPATQPPRFRSLPHQARDTMTAAAFTVSAAAAAVGGTAYISSWSPGRTDVMQGRGFAMPEPVTNTVNISGNKPPPIASPFSVPSNQPTGMQLGRPSVGASLPGTVGSGNSINDFIVSRASADAMQEGGGWGDLPEMHAELLSAAVQQRQPRPQQQQEFSNPYSTLQRAHHGSTAGAAAVAAFAPPPDDNVAPLWATRAQVAKAKAPPPGGNTVTSGDIGSPPTPRR